MFQYKILFVCRRQPINHIKPKVKVKQHAKN
jgi:hypothetical protein